MTSRTTPPSPAGTPFLGDLPLEELDAQGRRALEWLVGYLRTPERFPVLSPVKPGDVRDAIPASPPKDPVRLATLLDDFERVIVPGLTHWNHPGFLAYFSISASIPGIVGELLAAGLDTNGMLWKTSPAATELEERALSWLAQLLGVPTSWFGIICDTASISTFLALAAAREMRPGLDVRAKGLAGRDLPTMRVYCSEHAHSSVDKAVMALGLGHENLVKVGCDARFRMRPELLERAMADDVARGMLPIAVVATVGTTSVASVDPVREVADVASRFGAWLHVDGAYGGAAAALPERRDLFAALDLADSVVVNPHKWLFVPVDCSAFWTKRPEVLKRAFSLVPEYLVTAHGDAVTNYMDYGVQLGRRFRALKLWMVLSAFGTEGIAARVRHHCELARRFAGWVDAEPGWEVVAPVDFSLVCFRWAPADVPDERERERVNAAVMERVNAGGRAFLSHTKLDGRHVLRLAIGNIRTEERHVRAAWEELRDAAPLAAGERGA